jgi:hypothetical protein
MKSKSRSEGYPIVGFFTDKAIPLSGTLRRIDKSDAPPAKTKQPRKRPGAGKDGGKGRKKK